jgi:NADPH:quinone reductase-like Zn-dependent oxidoreductase
MKAVVVREHGGLEALRIESRDVPEPGPGEARVRVRAVALNHLDVWVRKGVPGHAFPLPLVPGCDIAGVVDALEPGAAGFAAGAEVVVGPGVSCGRCRHCRSGRDSLCRHYGILGETRDGGCADFVVVPAVNLFAKPAALDFPHAAAVPLVFLTAWHMLVARAAVEAGEQVLVHAAGAGVSTAAIQIARLLGARVLATAGTDEKCARALELGAEVAVNYRLADFADAVKQWTGRRGVDVAVDHVGADTFDRTLRVLAKGGRYVTCGATSGPEMKTDFRLVFFKSLSILGSTMGGSHELDRVLGLVGEGRLRPVVDQVLPLARIADGHARLEARTGFGKVVVVPEGP